MPVAQPEGSALEHVAETRAGAGNPQQRHQPASGAEAPSPTVSGAIDAALSGGPERHHEKTEAQGKLPVRERVARLIDPGSFSEEALLANWEKEGLGADGVVTGLAKIGGRTVALMANDPTVKAGSWGPKTVEKILRVQERALRLEVPMVYLVDSAGARITDQVQMFPGRRGAGRIFHNEVVMSGRVPQVCLLFGPSAAGGAYIPAFCDVVIMRDGNASMYLGSPRMAEMVIGEKVTLEEMGGARMHTSVSGCGHFLVTSDSDAIDLAKRYLSYMPQSWRGAPPAAPPADPASERRVSEVVPADENTAFDIKDLIGSLVDADSFCEVHARWAKELVVGFARLDGRAIGIVANQPKMKGGVLFVDSADKAARFIWTCNAFNVPLLFLADVPGFMIGTQVERQGIIRHGAKMISAVSEATVPKISVIVRKAYGAGLYAMAGPAFEPDCCIALPSASIAVMGPEAAINAVFYNQIQGISDPAEREEFVRTKRAEYAADIDILHLASELVVDAVIEPDQLRAELVRRFEESSSKDRRFSERHNPITPA
jgi:acetyl-CoA carboxylase carboxyltransferase component